MNLPNMSGHFVYRSLHNNPSVGENFLHLKFGEGVMTIQQAASGNLTGIFEMSEAYQMTLEGVIASTGDAFHVKMTGKGIPNTATAGWIYDYEGYVTPKWANGINQLTTITGSVIRTVDHDGAKAGVTATFYLVKSD